MQTAHPNLSAVPLLREEHVDSAVNGIEALARMSAAVRAGKLPTSQQLAAIVQRLLKSNALQPDLGSRVAGRVGGGKLSPKGREVVVAAREVLEALVRVGMEKNSDDKIQRFIWATSQASLDLDVDASTPDLPVPSNREIAQAEESLKQLGTLLLTSSNLRGVIADAVNLARDLFADAAEQVASAAIQTTKASKKAADKARPSEDDRKKGRTGLEDKELPSAKEVKKHTIRGIEDARDDAEAALRAKGKEVKSYVDEKLPTDVKDAFIERFKAIVNEIQSDPQYSDAVDTLFGLVRKYARKSADAVKEVAETASADVEANKEAESAATLLRQIVESFTGPLDGVFNTADKVIKDLKDDSRIQRIVDEAEKLLDRAINDPGYVTSSRCQRRIESLYDEGQEVVNANASWKRDVDALTSELNKCLDRAQHDKALQQLGDRVEKFFRATAKFGRTGFNLIDGGGIWSDLTQVLVPRLLGALHAIPLPRVEFTSADVDLVVDNVRFTSESFVPDEAHFRNRNEVSCKKGYAAYASEFETATTISFSGLRLQAKDISYFVHKKTGWIGIEDYGLMDIDIGHPGPDADDGLDVTLTVENAKDDDRETFFKLNKVECHVDGFRVRIHDSKNPIRAFFAGPAMRGYFEKNLIQVLEAQIAQGFQALDKQAYEMSLKASGARLASPDPLTFLRAIFTPTGPSSVSSVSSTGITRVGPKGAWILAIGVDEALLPGVTTGLSYQGRDVVSRKRNVESLIEEGRHEVEQVREQAEGVLEEVSDEAQRIRDEEHRDRAKEESRRDGWRSEAFSLA